MNLAGLVRLQATQRPGRIAVRQATRTLSYGELWRSVAAAIQRLNAAGVRAGDRVGVCLADTEAHVVMHFAVAGCGGCLVPIDHRATDSEVARLARAFDVRLLVADTERDTGAESDTLVIGAQIEGSDIDVSLADGDERPWLVSLSSGTTGQPKGALVTHRQMRERFVTQWVSLGFNSEDRFALVTPLVFGAGRSFAMSTLAAGGELILAPPPLPPAELVAALNDFQATTTFLVPTLMRRLLALPGDTCLLPGLRRLLISGEAFFPQEIELFQQRLSRQLIGYYASSEGGGVSVLQPGDFATHGASVGQAAFGVDVQIVDDAGREVPPGTVGELRYRGPAVTTQSLGPTGTSSPATRTAGSTQAIWPSAMRTASLPCAGARKMSSIGPESIFTRSRSNMSCAVMAAFAMPSWSGIAPPTVATRSPRS